MWSIVAVVAAVVLVATYVTWIASRLDRLHERAAAAHSALDAQLVRRAAAAAALAETLGRPELRHAARVALAAADSVADSVADSAATSLPVPPADTGVPTGPAAVEPATAQPAATQPATAQPATAQPATINPARADRDVAENDLTRELRRVPLMDASPAAAAAIEASRRVALTRQVHNDSVRDALAIRRRPLVRLLRLARRHPAPAYFDVDDPMLDSGVPAS